VALVPRKAVRVRDGTAPQPAARAWRLFKQPRPAKAATAARAPRLGFEPNPTGAVGASLVGSARALTGTSSGIQSDEFNSASLNTGLWTYLDPVGDTTLAFTGTHATISLPAGTRHDLWTGVDEVPRLLQPAPMPPAEGSLRDQLIAVVEGWAESIAEVPAMLTALTWLASGPGAGVYSDVRQTDSDAAAPLRARIIQLYSVPFDAIFDSPAAAAEIDVPDRIEAIALLIGPLILGRLSTLADFDYHACTEAAVDGFLATHARKEPISAASTESAGA
jgi:hypothetical protein